MIGPFKGLRFICYDELEVAGREGGRDDIQVPLILGEDYDAFLLSCDLNNLFLIGSQL